jgi:hypothetical protein
MRICSSNNNVICKPFKLSSGLTAEVTSAFAVVKQKVDVVALEVAVESIVTGPPTERLSPGSKIFVKEERLSTMPWGKQILRLNGQEVVVIPGTEVLAVGLAEENREPT